MNSNGNIVGELTVVEVVKAEEVLSNIAGYSNNFPIEIRLTLTQTIKHLSITMKSKPLEGT